MLLSKDMHFKWKVKSTACRYTGLRQNNGNTTYTVHISLLVWCWTTFCLQHTCNNSSYGQFKFWTGSNEILYHSSWRTSSNSFRDAGGVNLFLTLVCKIDPDWFSDVQIWWLCWPGKMLKFAFLLFKPWPNSSNSAMSPILGSTPRLTDYLTDHQSQCDFDFD
jgi:hypothetical protein